MDNPRGMHDSSHTHTHAIQALKKEMKEREKREKKERKQEAKQVAKLSAEKVRQRKTLFLAWA